MNDRPDPAPALIPRPLRSGWHLQSSVLVPEGGETVSTVPFVVTGWHPVEVPVTVLSALVRHGVYPDPRFGLNALRIPDSCDAFNEQHDLARFSHLPDGRNPWHDPWWYRTEFELEPLASGQRVWLILHGVNYRAEVWVNGRFIAGKGALVGMFQRFRLDVTEQVIAGRNGLAVLVFPVDHPGRPDTQLEVFGPVRNFHQEICHDVTEVMTIGYDCFPTVPDRNLGLFQEVALQVTGPVDLRHPFVRADLPLPELNPARLTISAELVNAIAVPVRAVLEGVVTAPDTGTPVACFRHPFTLSSNETRTVTLAAIDAPELALTEPRLWWPNTYGEQPLYGLTLRVLVDGVVTAESRTPFGIRRLDRQLHRLDKAHGFRLLVNGRPVFQRGGYVQPEMLFDWDPVRVEAELRYLAEANLNFLVFEDIPNPPDWYLDLCDRYGLLFWNCFYGCYWLQPDQRWQVDLQVLEDCTVDLVKRYRNHPSLVLYMAQNEGETRQDVYEMWRRTVLGLDPTRFLVPSGSFPDYRTEVAEWFAPDLPVGMNDYPPKTYSWQLPAVYYRLVRDERNWMFMIESCSASVPPLESLIRFIPGLRDLPPNPGIDPRYPLDSTWAHFGANSYYEGFDQGLRLLYGEPKDVRDYVWKAHLVAYDQHRAFFEAVHHRIWEITSGFGEWKLNSAWPDVQWQLYDWFLRPMVSLYAVRRACARLVVQRCPLDGMVSVVSNLDEPAPRVRVEAAVYDLDLRVLHRASAEAEALPNRCTEALHLPSPGPETPVYFVRLELRDPAGSLLADNFYWLSPRLDDCVTAFEGDLRRLPANRPLLLPRQTPCFPELAGLPEQAVELQATRLADTGSHTDARFTVRIANPGPGLAFFARLRLLDADNGEEVLPVYWSDNYLSLLPGEHRTLIAGLPRTGPRPIRLAVDGWNLTPGEVAVGE